VSRDLLGSLDGAVSRLGEALDAPATDLNRDASIQRFEFCFVRGMGTFFPYFR